MPLKASRFEYYLKRWPLENEQGQYALQTQQIVIIGDRLLSTRIFAKSLGNKFQSHEQLMRIYNYWNDYFDSF